MSPINFKGTDARMDAQVKSIVDTFFSAAKSKPAISKSLLVATRCALGNTVHGSIAFFPWKHKHTGESALSM